MQLIHPGDANNLWENKNKISPKTYKIFTLE